MSVIVKNLTYIYDEGMPFASKAIDDISFEIKENKNILQFQQTNKSVGAKKKVTGRIVDENDEPLIGASVIIKGSTQGTITNIDGEYTLEDVPEKATLTVSYEGYIPATGAVKGKNAINVMLQEDSKTMEEVVVIGYGTGKKSNLTGAVASVANKDLMADVALLDGVALGTALSSGMFSDVNSITFLLGVSDLLEEYTRKRTKNALADSLAMKIDTVWKKNGEKCMWRSMLPTGQMGQLDLRELNMKMVRSTRSTV